MEKDKELRFLREEITRLRLRVYELDSHEEPTSAVCGHDVTLTKKLAINKAIEIFKIVYDQTGINYGNRLPYDTEEFLAIVKAHPGYVNLSEKNIGDSDILEYLRQSNI